MRTAEQQQETQPQLYFDEDKLWAMMVRRKVSPKALIQETDVEPRAFAEWITGTAEPRPSNIRRIARTLGVKPESLMSEYAAE
jgi:transcriptional regulator with XRE-family HTH domain